MLYEDAATLTVGSVTIYPYGLTLALGAGAAIALFAALCRARRLAPGTAAIVGALAPFLGLVLARAVYCLVTIEFFASVQNFLAMLRLSDGGLSMFGALGGATLAGALAARWTRQDKGAVLDALSPALMLFVCVARLGEGFVQLGFSRTLVESEFLRGTFLALEREYDFVLKTYLLEAIAAAALCAVLCGQLLGARKRRPGDAYLRGMLYFGCTQIFLESLRYDMHMAWGFVCAQQLFAMLTACAAILVFARRAQRLSGRKGTFALTLMALVALAGAIVGLEFVIDRSGISRYIDYAVFAALMAGMLYLGERLYQRSDALWNQQKSRASTNWHARKKA